MRERGQPSSLLVRCVCVWRRTNALSIKLWAGCRPPVQSGVRLATEVDWKRLTVVGEMDCMQPGSVCRVWRRSAREREEFCAKKADTRRHRSTTEIRTATHSFFRSQATRSKIDRSSASRKPMHPIYDKYRGAIDFFFEWRGQGPHRSTSSNQTRRPARPIEAQQAALLMYKPERASLFDAPPTSHN